MSKPTASFNGSDLASTISGLIIIACLPNRFPNRGLSIAALANADKSVMPMSFYRDKKINVIVEIGQNTRELLDAAIDSLYGLLQPQEAALVCSVGTGTRQWTATLDNVTITDINGGHATLDIEFQCSDPFGYDTSTTPLFDTSLTGANSTTTFVVGGTAAWQQPVITITFSALTGGTNATVTISNGATNQTLTITRTWTSGDVLVIDSVNKTVKVNSTTVARSGVIPEWAGTLAGTAGSMTYTDTLTTRTRRMVGTLVKRYV